MAKFSASDVALTGFGVVSKRPTVLIWWIALHFLFMGSITALFVTVGGPVLTQMIALQTSGTPTDPQTQAEIFALFSQIAPLYLLMFPLTLVFYAVLFAAMNRAVLRPANSAFGYLRLGADEWRQFVLMLWAFVVALGLELAVFIGGAIVAVIAVAIFGAMHKGGYDIAGGAGGGTLAAIGLVLVYIAAYFYVLVRFSLASAMTFDTGKVSLLRSWRLTRGRFWSMFGTYVLATILSVVISLLGLVVMIVCAMLVGGVGGLGFVFRPDMSSPAAYFTPARMVYLALSGVLYALVWPILLTPSAAIYKIVTHKPEEPTPASWPSPPPFATPQPDPAVEPPDAPAHP
jgi:hypothetical protein